MIANPYKHATFLKSAAQMHQLPGDVGIEVAFVGRSNAGKSSALNTLTTQKKLARTSKTPGRTQLINLFALDDTRRLVDLPGYGYAKVTQTTRERWQRLLAEYLQKRASLKGLIILMDSRHPFTPLDTQLLDLISDAPPAIHILLTKSDKLSKSQRQQTLAKVKQQVQSYPFEISVQTFSALKKEGVETLIEVLNHWFFVDKIP